jgi:hypothetical protein
MQTSAREGDEIGGGFSGKARTEKLWSSSAPGTAPLHVL